MHMITVVLDHPQYCELSSIIFQKDFKRYQDAWVCYRDLCDFYIEGHYTVVYDIDKDFHLEEYNVLLREMRHNL